MIDAHAHLTDPRMGDVGAALSRARAAGVDHVVMGGTHPEEWTLQRRLRAEHESVSMVFGLHPWWASERRVVDRALKELEEALVSATPPAAIGETGLDRSGRHAATLDLQLTSLHEHLEMAVRFGLPVVLHVVQAHGLMLETLRELGSVPAGVVHAFDGSAEVARAYQALGLHLSVGGRVCAPEARRLHRALPAISAERLLLETDAPDQLPPGVDADFNDPSFLPGIAQRVAELRGEPIERVIGSTASNARRLFRLPT